MHSYYTHTHTHKRQLNNWSNGIGRSRDRDVTDSTMARRFLSRRINKNPIPCAEWISIDVYSDVVVIGRLTRSMSGTDMSEVQNTIDVSHVVYSSELDNNDSFLCVATVGRAEQTFPATHGVTFSAPIYQRNWSRARTVFGKMLRKQIVRTNLHSRWTADPSTPIEITIIGKNLCNLSFLGCKSHIVSNL